MNRLRALRTQQGATQKEMADFLGVDRTTYTKYESGKSEPSNEIQQRLAAFFKVSIDYLTGFGDTPSASAIGAIPITSRRIPLLGEIHCGEPSYAEQDFETYVEVGATVHADFALRAKGDSMIGARIQDGDLVFIRQQDTVQSGEIAAVLIDDDAALKRVRYLPGGLTMLQAENPAYEPIFVGGEGETRCVRILGKAIAFQGDVK